MKLNVMTLGQQVRVRYGRYQGCIGYIQRLYLLADTYRVCNMARVRIVRSMSHGVSGRRNYPIDLLEVVCH